MADLTKQDLIIGVDLGGTKILAGVFLPNLKMIGTNKLSTKAQRGPEPVIDRIARCIKDSVDECDLDFKQVKGVGVGAPGAIDPEAGKVHFSPNLPDWKEVPLKKELEKRLGVPVFVDNDCNVCTMGVYEAELDGKPKTMVGIFVGTGIGGGIIVDGKPYSGFNRTAGEIGHMVLETGGPKCGCGNRGCFEALASRTAIFKKIIASVKDGQKTILTDMLGPDLDDLRSGDLRKALKRGDKLVAKVVEEAAEYIGIAVSNLMNILNPEVVILGGGVIDALEGHMLSIIYETAMESAMPGTTKGVEILASELGDDAGITGGAVLARRALKAAS